MSGLCNKSTFSVCQLLFYTMTFGLFKVSSKDAGKFPFSRSLVSLLLNWSIPLTYVTNSIVCDFNLLKFNCPGLLCSVAQVGSYTLIFRDVNLVPYRERVGVFNNRKHHNKMDANKLYFFVSLWI